MQYTVRYVVHIYLQSTVSTVVIGMMFTRTKTTLLNHDNP